MKIESRIWGKTPDGKEIVLYTITNESGASVSLSSVGAGIVSVNVPDKDGKLADVVIGYDDPMSYFGDGPCAGKCPGRYANRIAKGHFTLDGKEYTLPINNACNHLHGGPEGFQNQVWESRTDGDAVEFMYFSEDGEAGYPGNLKVVARYTWSEENELTLTFTAETDAPTVLNLTNHSYFNLNGEGSGTVLNHILKLNASEFLPTDETLIPLGEPADVAGTPMDFVTAKPIGQDIRADFEQLHFTGGYDHNYVLGRPGEKKIMANAYCRESGIALEAATDCCGVQFYAGNFIGEQTGKGGAAYHDRSAFCLESQFYPNAVNEPDFPSPVVKAGDTYHTETSYRFYLR